MNTEFLSDWEILALETLVETAKNSPAYYDPDSINALADKLHRATRIRLSYKEAK